MSKRTIYVCVPVQVVIYDGEVNCITVPSNKDIERSIATVGYWDDKKGALVAIEAGPFYANANIDKILEG